MASSNRLVLDDIDGTTIKGNDGQEYTIHLLPPEMIDLMMEIYSNHPKLAEVLLEASADDNYSVEVFFGSVAAYCGLVLDSSDGNTAYTVGELIEQLGNALINKRENMAVSVNSVPTVQALIGGAVELREAAREREKAPAAISLDTKVH